MAQAPRRPGNARKAKKLYRDKIQRLSLTKPSEDRRQQVPATAFSDRT